MSKLLTITAFLVLVVLLACSNPTATPLPTSAPAPTATLAPTAEPTPTLMPEPTAVPQTPPAPGDSGEEKMDSESGGLVPFADPDSFLTEISKAEEDCLSGAIGADRLEMLAANPMQASDEESNAMMGCMGHDTLLRLFLTGILNETGTLSVESSRCIREAFADIDLASIMQPPMKSGSGLEQDPAAQISAFIGMFSTLACLNEEEWAAAGPVFDLAPEDREGLHCVLDELGGPEELAALMDPQAGPPIALFAAAESCNLSMFQDPSG